MVLSETSENRCAGPRHAIHAPQTDGGRKAHTPQILRLPTGGLSSRALPILARAEALSSPKVRISVGLAQVAGRPLPGADRPNGLKSSLTTIPH